MQSYYRTLSGGADALLIGLFLLFPVWQQPFGPVPARTIMAAPAVQQPLTAVTQLASGRFHTCGITSSGGVKCWGANWQGQLGDGGTTYRTTAVPVNGLSGPAIDLAVGDRHTCAVTNAGAVHCWGDNTEGQLGNDTFNQSFTPVTPVGLGQQVTAVVAGAYHTCALVGGAVYCWGNNDAGQLGDGSLLKRRLPTPVIGLSSNVIALTANNFHTCALLTGGAIHCWGANSGGQLGNGEQNNGSSTPVAVKNLTGATALAAGDQHTCAIVNGGLWCWGDNSAGQLGDGSITSQSTPVAVTDMSSGVVSAVGGLDFTCALRSDGNVTAAYCWGANWNGALGNGTNQYRRTPAPVVDLHQGVVALSVGGHTACALVDATSGAGRVQCWGVNREGQLGDGALLYRALPAPVADLPTPATAVATGGSHTCAIQASNLFCWGANGYHQLGVTDRGLSTLPVALTALGTAVTAVGVGEEHSCAAKSNGNLWCWGFNWAGQIGNGTTHQTELATVPYLPTGAVAVDAGAAHTCALTQAGAVYCWGANWDGRLGDGSYEKRLTPAAVQGLPAPAAAIDAGHSHTCALTTGGAVFCWGNNDAGQIGDSTNLSQPQPVAVRGLISTVTAIAVGGNHSCVLVDGAASADRVLCWGANQAGQLGDGATTNRVLPVVVQGLPAQLAKITAAGVHTCALTTAGAVYCWGANRYGQLGDSTTSDRYQPVAVTTLDSGVTALAAGDNHTCALTTGGNVLCWGLDHHGQLGSGIERWRTTPTDVVEDVAAPPITPTPSATVTTTTPTSTPTRSPAAGDAFEADDTCATATELTPNGAIQAHTFHQADDQDWVRFTVTAGITYTIEADAPAPSPADLVLALYAQCDGGAQQTQDYAFSPNARLTFVATGSGVYYLRLRNQQRTAYGSAVTYQLSVRAWSGVYTPGALIIVAGRQREGDLLQSQIHNVTNRVYRLWRNQGHPANRIRYFATDLNLDPDRDGRADVDGLPDQANLRNAITQWAVDKVGPTRVLTLFLMDHGGYDALYLDEPRRERLSPHLLDQWLTQLESAAPGVKITVLIEACNAGSFIDPEQSVSKAGRIVISSTGAYDLAWATNSGAVFSDALLDGLALGKTLLGAFYQARASAQAGLLHQTPWLDDDGDRVPNDPDDGALAAQSSFRTSGSLNGGDLWQPYIVWGEVRQPTDGTQRGAPREIWAEVRDDRGVQSVLAVIYPPSYQPPSRGDELVAGPPPITLQARGNDRYAGSYGDFSEAGEYRIFIYALDSDGLHSPPAEIRFQNGSRLFLPLVRR